MIIHWYYTPKLLTVLWSVVRRIAHGVPGNLLGKLMQPVTSWDTKVFWLSHINTNLKTQVKLTPNRGSTYFMHIPAYAIHILKLHKSLYKELYSESLSLSLSIYIYIHTINHEILNWDKHYSGYSQKPQTFH